MNQIKKTRRKQRKQRKQKKTKKYGGALSSALQKKIINTYARGSITPNYSEFMVFFNANKEPTDLGHEAVQYLLTHLSVSSLRPSEPPPPPPPPPPRQSQERPLLNLSHQEFEALTPEQKLEYLLTSKGVESLTEVQKNEALTPENLLKIYSAVVTRGSDGAEYVKNGYPYNSSWARSGR
jgi:hypothetical protein